MTSKDATRMDATRKDATMAHRLLADRLARRGQGGFALMAGLAIWVGVSGVTMVALLNMTMTSSRIAASQAASAAQFRAVDAAMETAVTQIRMDPDALVGASTGKDDGSCVEPLGTGGSDGLLYRDDAGITVSVTARCGGAARGTSRLADADMAAEQATEQPKGTEQAKGAEPADQDRSRLSTGQRIQSSESDLATGRAAEQSVRSVELLAVMTLPDGTMRSAGSARIRVSDARGNGSSVVIDDWSLTPDAPYVPPPTTTTTSTTTTVKPTTTTTTTPPTTTTSTTTTTTPPTTTTSTTSTTTTVKPTTTTAPAAPSPATWTMRITSDWTTGYCAEVTVTNPTSSPLTWIVDTPIEGQIYSFWNGEYTRSGNTLRVRGVDWNKTIDAGATAGFGFCSNR